MSPLPPDGQIDLWIAALSCDAGGWSRGRHLLDESELIRYERFRCEDARLQFLVGRILLRTTLSRYASREATWWRFRQNPYGRPAIYGADEVSSRLFFNLTHTRGMVICAIANTERVGVDVERRDRSLDVNAMAPSCLSLLEITRLRACPPDRRIEAFLTNWTLKEAYIKAQGVGLNIPLQSFWVDPAGDPPTLGAFDHGIEDARCWRFQTLLLGEAHIAAVAVRHKAVVGLQVLEHWVGPEIIGDLTPGRRLNGAPIG